MPTIKALPVSSLSLDLENFRTVKQPDELHALHAMVSASPDYFWALMDSLLESGYLPTENIIVLESAGPPSTETVKEGNRRVAALKVIHGYLSPAGLAMPASVMKKIGAVSAAWKTENSSVPCTIYPPSEAATVDRIITLAHGKGEKAGRDSWNAVARARHHRARGGTEAALDLLEKYLEHGTNLSTDQADRWAGEYPLTVLEEAMKKLSSFFGASSAPDLAKNYPGAISQRPELEQILWAIGQEMIRFPHLRKGLPKLITDYKLKSPAAGSASSGGSGASGSGGGGKGGSGPSGRSSGAAGSAGASGSSASASKKPKTTSTRDPRTVTAHLKKLTVRGANRQKVEALREECVQLDISKTPIAFCFLLRSMFEISAKAYVGDHSTTGGPSLTKKNGRDKDLADLLGDIVDHMVATLSDADMKKKLHGAKTEITKKDGLLSVMSMNQLVHNPTFSIAAGDIAILFGNVFPLLEEMNR